jgi:hypothetical protein
LKGNCDRGIRRRVYDATDEDYILEDDLFRNYYKLKKTVREIQEEKEEEI